MTDADRRPAYYSAGSGRFRDWWLILHPPYTAWHLSYVVIGAALAPHLDGVRLLATVLAFFAAVGISAHVFDELHGRPLHTHIPDSVLMGAGVGGLFVAVALGIAGLDAVGWILLPFIVVGPFLVLAYNLELFGGLVHTDLGFVLAWGAFPVLTGYVAEAGRLDAAAVLAAAGACALAYAQRSLSAPARLLRRHVERLDGSITLDDGRVQPLDEEALLAPLERALRSLSWAVMAMAAALLVARVA